MGAVIGRGAHDLGYVKWMRDGLQDWAVVI